VHWDFLSPAIGRGGSVRLGLLVSAPEQADVGEPSNPVSRGGLLPLVWSASVPSTGGSAMFRVRHRGEGIDDADTIQCARGIVRSQSPGRYDVDEIRAEPLPSGHTSRQWDRLILHPDGRVELEPRPWPD
jgi:hypothetical protein